MAARAAFDKLSVPAVVNRPTQDARRLVVPMPASSSHRIDARLQAAAAVQSSRAGARIRHAASVIVVAPDSFKGSLGVNQTAWAAKRRRSGRPRLCVTDAWRTTAPRRRTRRGPDRLGRCTGRRRLVEHRRRLFRCLDAVWQSAVYRLPARRACGRAGHGAVGAPNADAPPRLSEHFAACFSPVSAPMSLDVTIRNAPTLLSDAAKQLVRVKLTFLH